MVAQNEVIILVVYLVDPTLYSENFVPQLLPRVLSRLRRTRISQWSRKRWKRFRRRKGPRRGIEGALSELGYNNFRGLDESGERAFIEALAATSSKELVFDIGAHSGLYSQILADNFFTDVHMFEPHPMHRLELQALSRRTGFIHHECAIGSYDGSAELWFHNDSLAHASISTAINLIPYIRNEDVVNVRMRTLDRVWEDLGFPKILLVKIDVEGWEHEVLLGAARMFTEAPPVAVQIEMNWHQLVRGHSLYSLSQLMPEGHLCFQMLPKAAGLRQVDVLDPLSNIYLYSNFVFVSPEVAKSLR